MALGVSAAAAGAAQISVQELQEKMLASDLRLTSLKVDYAQKMTSSLTAEVKKTSGTAYLRKPRELRIEQGDPEPQIIVASGKTVQIYTPRFRQVVKDSWQRWSDSQLLLPGIAGFGQTLDRLKKEYAWDIQGSTVIKGMNMILLKLSKPDGAAERENLTMWISETDFIPRRSELVMGTLKMTTEVKAIELNPELDRALFRFQPPKDTTVIQAP